jgi:hypothetical protein
MKVLVACEYRGRVRDAFAALGHDAVSCDLLPTDAPGPHYQGDVRDLLGQHWDLLVAFPPCTYLCSSGLHWNKRRPERAQQTASGQNNLGPSADRWKIRSQTYPGIARAMAEQWGGV